MRKSLKILQLVIAVMSTLPTTVRSEMIDMRDFIQLRNGMTEAEVLYRVGAYDYESIATDHYHNITRRTWYYIPFERGSDTWITEISFNRRGQVESMKRYRARRMR